MFIESLKYPFQKEDSIKTIIIGTLLVIGSVLIIPFFILLGYLLKVTRQASQGDQAPKFENYLELLADGFKLFIVMIAYGLIIVLLGVLTGTAIEISEPIGIIMSLVVLPLVILYHYSVPAIIYLFSQETRVKDAFQFREIKNMIFQTYYLKIILMLIGALILITSAQYAISLLLMITIVGVILIPILIPAAIFYESMVYFKLFAETKKQAEIIIEQ